MGFAGWGAFGLKAAQSIVKVRCYGQTHATDDLGIARQSKFRRLCSVTTNERPGAVPCVKREANSLSSPYASLQFAATPCKAVRSASQN
jgi:hypothetical protein